MPNPYPDGNAMERKKIEQNSFCLGMECGAASKPVSGLERTPPGQK